MCKIWINQLYPICSHVFLHSCCLVTMIRPCKCHYCRCLIQIRISIVYNGHYNTIVSRICTHAIKSNLWCCFIYHKKCTHIIFCCISCQVFTGYLESINTFFCKIYCSSMTFTVCLPFTYRWKLVNF